MKFVVFTELLTKGSISRWYYGTYDSEQRADEVAYSLGHNPSEGIWHSWCRLEEVSAYKVLNMPTV